VRTNILRREVFRRKSYNFELSIGLIHQNKTFSNETCPFFSFDLDWSKTNHFLSKLGGVVVITFLPINPVPPKSAAAAAPIKTLKKLKKVIKLFVILPLDFGTPGPNVAKLFTPVFLQARVFVPGRPFQNQERPRAYPSKCTFQLLN
jgi:hypothetical protein